MHGEASAKYDESTTMCNTWGERRRSTPRIFKFDQLATQVAATSAIEALRIDHHGRLSKIFAILTV